MNKHRLQTLDIEAWGYVLRQNEALTNATVTAVSAEPITPQVTRYTLTLTGLSEPITLVGKKTTAVEARFYQRYAAALADMLPYCWLAEADGTESWILLDDADHHHAPVTWQITDLERLVSHLATLHTTFWGQNLPLEQAEIPLLPQLVGPPKQPRPVAEWRRRVDRLVRTTAPTRATMQSPLLSEAGQYTAVFMKAQAGLQILRKLGGWPGIITNDHIEAADRLLNNADLLLTPLREIPYTLLHGRVDINNWLVSLWGKDTLLDWRTAAWGPAPVDLIFFLESFYEHSAHHSESQHYPHWPLHEETLIDGYFLQLAAHLDEKQYDARYLRRYTLPSARCLHVVTRWFTTFADWFMRLPHSRHTWEMLADMDDQQLAAIGYTPVIGVRPHLKLVFDRFLDAYRLLCM